MMQSFRPSQRQVSLERAQRSVLTRAKGFGDNTQKPVQQRPAKQMRMGNTLSKKQQAAYDRALSQVGQGTQDTQEPTSDTEDDVVDPRVANRMLSRVLVFAGLPVFFGLLLYPFFYYLKVVQKIDLPMGLVFVVQSITFGAGLLGITYGATSASWDPRLEGSALGWNEFRANLSAIMKRK